MFELNEARTTLNAEQNSVNVQRGRQHWKEVGSLSFVFTRLSPNWTDDNERSFIGATLAG